MSTQLSSNTSKKKHIDPLELLGELVAINSVNPFETVQAGERTLGIGNEGPINEYLEQILTGLGFAVRRQYFQQDETVEVAGQERHIPARYNLLAEKGQGTRSLLLFAHTDTVDVKDGWKTNPFQLTAEMQDGRKILRALGANDMKGGIASFISAVSMIDEPPADWNIKIALFADEEFWSFGAVAALQDEFLSDVELALVPEISEAGCDSTVQWLGVGRLGRSEFVFDVTGHACHGADAFVHPKAVNAVQEAAKLEVEVINYCESIRKEFSLDGIKVTNSAYLNQHIGGKGILSVPDKSSFVLDRTLVPGEDPEQELVRLRRVIADAIAAKKVDSRAQFTVEPRKRPTPACKPYSFAPSSTPVAFVANAAKDLSPEIMFGIGRSVADENRIAELGIPVVIIAPNGEGSHTSEEWVDAESLIRIRDIFYRAILALPEYRTA